MGGYAFSIAPDSPRNRSGGYEKRGVPSWGAVGGYGFNDRFRTVRLLGGMRGAMPPIAPQPPETMPGAAGGYAHTTGGGSLTMAPDSPRPTGGSGGLRSQCRPRQFDDSPPSPPDDARSSPGAPGGYAIAPAQMRGDTVRGRVSGAGQGRWRIPEGVYPLDSRRRVFGNEAPRQIFCI